MDFIHHIQGKGMTSSTINGQLNDLLLEIRVKTGNNAPGFTDFMSKLSALTDTQSAAQLIPTLRKLLDHGPSAKFFGAANVVNIFLSPFQNVINLINANETGLSFYAYRAIAYTVTAWAYNHTIPSESSTVLNNTQKGMGHTYGGINSYVSTWQKSSTNALGGIRKFCKEKNIPEDHMKIMLIAISSEKPHILSQLIMESYEEKIQFVVRNIWKSGYSIRYPQ